MLKKCLIVLLCLAVLAGAAFGVLIWNGMLGSVHPLKTPSEGQIRVACVGDSVTYGFGIPNRGKYCYPARLQELMGDGYCVNNYGYSGRTASDSGDRPYRAEKLYRQALDFQPDIVVVMLGSNDSKSFNWNPAAVRVSYEALLDDFAALESNPKIYVVIPTPVFPVNGVVKFSIDGDVIDAQLAPLVRDIAVARTLPAIDMHAVFEGRGDLFLDGCHLNRDGAELYAKTVYAAIAAGESTTG